MQSLAINVEGLDNQALLNEIMMGTTTRRRPPQPKSARKGIVRRDSGAGKALMSQELQLGEEDKQFLLENELEEDLSYQEYSQQDEGRNPIMISLGLSSLVQQEIGEEDQPSKESESEHKRHNLRSNLNKPDSEQNDLERSKVNGRWTAQEHHKFIEGKSTLFIKNLALVTYGKEWKMVEKHVETRSGAQIRSHAQKFFMKISDPDAYIQEQAELLRKEIKGSDVLETSQSSKTVQKKQKRDNESPEKGLDLRLLEKILCDDKKSSHDHNIERKITVADIQPFTHNFLGAKENSESESNQSGSDEVELEKVYKQKEVTLKSMIDSFNQILHNPSQLEDYMQKLLEILKKLQEFKSQEKLSDFHKEFSQAHQNDLFNNIQILKQI